MGESKMRFFREMKSYESDSKHNSEDESLVLPGSGLYVGPFARNANSSSVAVELSDDSSEGVDITYYKENTKYFATVRRDLPQFFIDSRVQVRMTPKMGKGCFATKDIEKHTIVESAPVILVHQDTFSNLNQYSGGKHKMSEYPFGWGRDGIVAFSLGYGGIYNHRVEPNLSWRPDYENESLTYTAIRDIAAGEELYIRYVPLSKLDVLWFSDEESEKYAEIYREQKKKEDLLDIKSWSALKM